MFANKKILLTTAAVVLSFGATTFIVHAVGNNMNDNQQNTFTPKKNTTAQSQSTNQNKATTANASSTSSQSSQSMTQKNSQVASADNSQSMKNNSTQTTNTDSQIQSGFSSNTLTVDDFRSSDDVAYRSIALYGMAHGDAQWQQLSSAQKKGIVMTKVTNEDNPTFVAKAVGSTTGAYYRFIMNDSTTTQSTSKPLSFSQIDATQYRASIADVLNYVNQVGGRQAIQKLNFQLIEN
ncbi:hypothetical protein [Fructobacillus tropaeoli]|uniref:hypothetical protein n=1 Tax=Fructobacillus tropaeoli TaxID=709323 RepID=UPI002D86AA4F|nr:unnamed protein product [Fructobacillus tropaeoli]